ncbi:PREDICTED: LOW QUALITY PROTEIN: protein GAMETE EXPRESSED 2 [Erythranthe guttata]|uniref:LOW QUALITY PROTEIN: protein GAMETE EXPRESSED 2 n=1 Tax=Erythranthe guttata TaxID=4155 RepID=UPI00064E0ACF|nr:PREDICTED: LOW QUALITY PROTEIN: protein GAMETE EXPRESSED 2 [Erythranthe guttata]|eukprot:XP_012828126.1 PREDICTED: LOW QUALITY PROTEIN: protein GAMETE EXPRESSED 2 [Erythranthe guttata]
MGNSSFITGVSLHFNGGTDTWRISFVPIMVGLFNVLVTDEHFRVLDSSLHFRVNSGKMYPAAGILSWRDGINEFIAGTKAELLILPKDAYGNNVSSDTEQSLLHNFTLSASTSNRIPPSVVDITDKRWNNQQGYLIIEFITSKSGNLVLHVQVENQTLHDSPLPFVVFPGELDVYSCVAELNVETKYFQLFSTMEGLIYQHDKYENLVSRLYAFDIEVIEKGTNLSMPLADLVFEEVGPGVQSFSFSLQESGSFMLVISDKEKSTLVSNTPYDFTVYIGYCDGANSIVNGSGLNNSVAGETERFSVFLKDAYLYPSPVELESLRVQIMHESDFQIVHPIINIRENRLDYRAINLIDVASSPFVDPKNNVIYSSVTQVSGNTKHKASDFDVIYTPEKSGLYEIRVFCGNIPLNRGRPFRKQVSKNIFNYEFAAGSVNVSRSGVMNYARKVPKMSKNEIIVHLVDSYSNPVLLEQSKLNLEIASINKSDFSTWIFSDNKDGSYSGPYLAKDVGTYEICASYNGERFLPCPFGVNVYNNEYFPKVYNDTVSVWEDESIAFNVLDNDYFAGGNASILEYTKPSHGSLLQYGNVFRYTPYRGLFGNDSFSYSIIDINGNFGSGAVDLLILCRPPQFISIPSNLQATEDLISPTFGYDLLLSNLHQIRKRKKKITKCFILIFGSGFTGFEIIYSDFDEIINVTLTSKSGNLSLSPMQMQFWQPKWDKLYVYKEANELKLVGSLYHFFTIFFFFCGDRNENFYGEDIIRVSTINRNGKNEIEIPIYVQPINDPPVVNTPSFVILDNMNDGILIFGQLSDEFDFIEDPDLRNFPGNRSRFSIMFSMEVSDGLLSTSLPANLVSSTELKTKSSYQWQPLQTFVTISKHFLVKAKGIRFKGTIDECNSIMQQLSYHEGEHGDVLTLTVNDLGNYGCYPNCDEAISMSLFAESTVNLIRHRPMSSLVAHTLGSAIVIESVFVFSLGLLLLFFVCKCAFVLVYEKKRKKDKEIELLKIEGSSTQTVSSI